jgi:hypothetical protein
MSTAKKDANVSERLTWSNAPVQARRTSDFRLSTEARLRRCLQPVCSVILLWLCPYKVSDFRV